MKQNITLILAALAFLICTGFVANETLARRSTNQIVIIDSGKSLRTEMNKWYTKGYRVVFMAGDGVSYGITVVMEK